MVIACEVDCVFKEELKKNKQAKRA